MLPQARQEKLLVQEVGDELVVYDQSRHQAHRLNRTAALIWQHCDGHTSVAELGGLLGFELGLTANQEVVWLALRQLGKSHLLRDPVPRTAERPGLSRRDAVRRLALAGAGVLLLPVVRSLTAPTPAIAQGYVVGCNCVCKDGTGACFSGGTCCLECSFLCSPAHGGIQDCGVVLSC